MDDQRHSDETDERQSTETDGHSDGTDEHFGATTDHSNEADSTTGFASRLARRDLLGLLGLGGLASLGLSTPARAASVVAGRYLEKSEDDVLDFTGAAEWENAGVYHNTAIGVHSVVSGGVGNEATGELAAVAGGKENQAADSAAAIGGGGENVVEGAVGTIGGGASNQVDGSHATVGGGLSNVASGSRSTVTGGRTNQATGEKATVGGGGPYSESTEFDGNRATSKGATVSGGVSNQARGESSTVGGGEFNRAAPAEGDDPDRTARTATIGGGSSNEARGNYSTVGGGSNNEAVAQFSAVAGGSLNEASGLGAAVPGGRKNLAAGTKSFAAGMKAKARHDNTFVWNDAHVDGEEPTAFDSTAPGQFLVHADGGVGIGTNEPRSPLHVNTDAFELPIGEEQNYTLENYLVSFEDTNNLRNTLALKTGQAEGEIRSDVNFVTFFTANEQPVGSIEGSGGAGVRLKSGGADYAERLPVRDGEVSLEAGEVVGVHAGKLSKATASADRAMVISEQPVVLGNAPPETDGGESDAEPVAFVGQVPTRVRGRVETGDLVVASGENDGTAIAVAPEEWRPDEHGPLVGRAWEDDDAEGVTKVTVAVGLDESDVLAERVARQGRTLEEQVATIEEQAARIDDLEAENAALRSRLDALEERVASVEVGQSAAEPSAAD